MPNRAPCVCEFCGRDAAAVRRLPDSEPVAVCTETACAARYAELYQAAWRDLRAAGFGA